VGRSAKSPILDQLQADAWRIAERFGLSYRGIAAEHPRVKSRYGVCYSDGLIKIRLNHAKTGRPLKYSSLVDTLCHEMAHLRHFNHGPEFKALFLRILEWARREGIYRPGPEQKASSDSSRIRAERSSAPELDQRNGVPVFPEPPPESEADVTALPWERLAGSLAVDGRRGGSPRRPAPRFPRVQETPTAAPPVGEQPPLSTPVAVATSPQRPARPVQLSLF